MKCLIKEKLSAHKYKDNNGYLICVDSVLARTGKQTYLRSEIFADAADDNTEVEVDRKPEEVFSEKTLASFENCPICVEHPDEDVNPENYKEYAVGFVRDVHKGMDDGKEVILGTLVITDAQTIEEIENGEHTDLSCGYDCDIDDSAHPQQRNIRGNHVALCEQGRAGNARIVDTAKKVNDGKYKVGQKWKGSNGVILTLIRYDGLKPVIKNSISFGEERFVDDFDLEDYLLKFNNYKMIDSVKDANIEEGKRKLDELVGKFTKQEMLMEINYDKYFAKYSPKEKEQLYEYADKISKGQKVFGYNSIKDDLVFGYTDLDLKKAEEMLAKAEDEKEKKLLQDLVAKIKFELKNKEYKEEVKDSISYKGYCIEQDDKTGRYNICEERNGNFIMERPNKEKLFSTVAEAKEYIDKNFIKGHDSVKDSERYLIRKDSGDGEIVYETDDLKDAIAELKSLGRSFYIDDTQENEKIDYWKAVKMSDSIKDWNNVSSNSFGHGRIYGVRNEEDLLKRANESEKVYIEQDYNGKTKGTWISAKALYKEYKEGNAKFEDSVKDDKVIESDRGWVVKKEESRFGHEYIRVYYNGREVQEFDIDDYNDENDALNDARMWVHAEKRFRGMNDSKLKDKYVKTVYQDPQSKLYIETDYDTYYVASDEDSDYNNTFKSKEEAIKYLNSNREKLVKTLLGDSIKDANHLVNVYNKSGKLLNSKRFNSRAEVDRYVSSLENFFDMTGKEDIYKNNRGELDIHQVWKVVVDDSIRDVEPHAGESKEDFIARFMKETKEEYPDEKQRLAVAYSYWEKKDMKDSTEYKQIEKEIKELEEELDWADDHNNVWKVNELQRKIDELRKKQSKYVKDAKIDYNDLRQFCIENKYYTRGTTAEYDRLLSNCRNWSIDEIAKDIAEHSDGVWSGVVYNNLLKKFPYALQDSVKDESYDMVQKDGLLYLKKEDGKLIGPFYTMKEACEYVKIKWNDSVKDSRPVYEEDLKLNDIIWIRNSAEKENHKYQFLGHEKGNPENLLLRDLKYDKIISLRFAPDVILMKDSVKDDSLEVLSKKYDVINRSNVDEFLRDFNKLYNRHLSADGGDIVNENYKDIYNVNGAGAQVEHLVKLLKNSIRDEKIIHVTLEGKTYKAVYNGMSSRYPDMADVYIPELALYNSDRYTPADDLGNHPKDGKYYIKKDRIYMRDEETTAERVTKKLEKGFESFKESRMKDAKLTYVFKYKDLYNNEVHTEEVKANSGKEAVEELRKRIGLRGIGTANVYVNHIDIKETGEYYPYGYGKLNSLVIDSKKLIDAVKIAKLSKIIKNKK